MQVAASLSYPVGKNNMFPLYGIQWLCSMYVLQALLQKQFCLT